MGRDLGDARNPDPGLPGAPTDKAFSFDPNGPDQGERSPILNGRDDVLSPEILQLRERIDEAARDRPSLSQLFERLQQLGVRPVPSLQKSGRWNGMSYDWNGVRYRGSDLGRAYTARGLGHVKGVAHTLDRDGALLREAENRARDHAVLTHDRRPDLRERSQEAREYDQLTRSQTDALRDIGRFRAVALDDFKEVRYIKNEPAWQADFAKLRAQNLVEMRSILITVHDKHRRADTRSLDVLVLTKKGHRLMKRFDNETRDTGQALYAGFVKPREIAHDSAIYRMYQAEAAHIERQGGRIKRVVLDFELKKKAYAPLARARQVSMDEYKRKQADIAREQGLNVVDGKIRLPDLRIEYETAQGEAARVDLELATEHYRADHMSAKERAGFKIYADSRSFPPGGSLGRSAVSDDHAIEIFSF